MNLYLGFAILALTGAAVLYAKDWLEGRSTTRGFRGIPSLGTAASLFVSVAFFLFNQHRGLAESLPRLAATVRPYPGATVVDAPAGPAAGVQIWKLESADAPEQVVAFYEKTAPADGWRLSRSFRKNPWTLQLECDQLRVFLTVARKPRGTSVEYLIQRRK